MWAVFLNKFFLGISLAAPLGPVSVEMIRRGLSHGFMSAFSVRCGGVIGNFLCLIAAYVGIAQILEYPLLLNVLGALGACLLIHMGLKALFAKKKTLNLKDGSSQVQSGLWWGLYLSIANPVALAFWPGLFAADLAQEGSICITGFMANLMILVGVLCWGASLALLASVGRRYLSEGMFLKVTRASGLMMLFFGGKYLWVVIEKAFLS